MFGKIYSYNKYGYGVIRSDNDCDYFAYMPEPLKRGQPVIFDVAVTSRGLEAVNVVTIKEAQ